jgi:hypothetical protein
MIAIIKVFAFNALMKIMIYLINVNANQGFILASKVVKVIYFADL